jgi:hypothetical protein
MEDKIVTGVTPTPSQTFDQNGLGERNDSCICFQDEHRRNCPAITLGTCKYQSLYETKAEAVPTTVQPVGTCERDATGHVGLHPRILPTRGETSWCIEFKEVEAVPPSERIMDEDKIVDDMKDELKEREQDYNTAERARKRGLRTQPKPGEPGYQNKQE